MSSFNPAVNQYGSGDLLPLAQRVFEETIHGTGWPYDGQQQIKDGPAGLTQAILLYLERPDGSVKYDAPLLAKSYMILRNEEKWWSVSERIIGSASSDIIFTYIHEDKTIYVTDRRNARTDPGDLRFGQTYRGWFAKDAVALRYWLSHPESLTVQGSLEDLSR